MATPKVPSLTNGILHFDDSAEYFVEYPIAHVTYWLQRPDGCLEVYSEGDTGREVIPEQAEFILKELRNYFGLRGE